MSRLYLEFTKDTYLVNITRIAEYLNSSYGHVYSSPAGRIYSAVLHLDYIPTNMTVEFYNTVLEDYSISYVTLEDKYSMVIYFTLLIFIFMLLTSTFIFFFYVEY